MTSRKRITAALNKREVDRLPFSPLLDQYFVTGLPQQGYHFDLLQAMDYIGCDIIMRHTPSYKTIFKGFTVNEKAEGDVIYTIYDTPYGSLKSSVQYTKGTFFIKEHLIKDCEDLKVAQFIAENTFFEPAFEQFYEVDKTIGERGIASPDGSITPIMEFIQFYAGLENATYLLMDYPDEVESLFDAMHRRNKRVYSILADLKCEAVFAYEDTSSTLLNMDWLERYAIPAVNDYAGILRGSGKVYITHMCGKLYAFRNMISRFKSDGIDSVCPPTTGDICLWDARKHFPEKVLIGGLEPPALARMSKEETLKYVIDFINNMPDKRGVILSTGDATPYGTPIENLRAITDLLNMLGEESLKTGIGYGLIEKIK